MLSTGPHEYAQLMQEIKCKPIVCAGESRVCFLFVCVFGVRARPAGAAVGVDRVGFLFVSLVFGPAR